MLNMCNIWNQTLISIFSLYIFLLWNLHYTFTFLIDRNICASNLTEIEWKYENYHHFQIIVNETNLDKEYIIKKNTNRRIDR